MSLGKKAPRGRHPITRERADVVKRFKRKCKKLGWTTEGALRQLIHSYLTNPYPFNARIQGGPSKGALLSSIHDDLDKVIAFRAHAIKAGITTGEAIRQLVAKDLEGKNV